MKSLKKFVFILTLTFFNQAALCQESSLWIRFKAEKNVDFKSSVKPCSSNYFEVNEIFEEYGVQSLIYPLKASKKQSLNELVEVKCDCNVYEFKNDLERLVDFVDHVELAPVITPLYTPNDFSIQSTSNYALDIINSQQAWDLTMGNGDVEIAVVDANFTITHEELVNKFVYYDSMNSNPNYAHGNCVAILAAGNTDNGNGVSSIGFNSQLQLRSLNYNQVLEATYSGAKIINLSWSSGCFFNLFIQEIINEVYENGSTIIAAAGNGNTCGSANALVYPASHEHVISVSSIGPYNNHERFLGDINSTHQHNSMVDICAPGYDVLVSPYANTYVTGNGTSFAAPIVSGVVALMLSVNPCLNSDQIEYILKESAMNIDYINPQYTGLIGSGRIDAYGAVQMAQNFSTLQLETKSLFDCVDSTAKLILLTDSIVPPFDIVWSTMDTTDVLYNPVSGNSYNVHVIDGNGCFGNMEVQFDTLSPLTVNIDVTDVNCYGQENGSIDLILSGGNGNYYQNFSPIMNDVFTVDNLYSGNYSFHIEDDYNCFIDTTISIIEPEQLNIELSYQETEYLEYGTIYSLVSGGTEPYYYQWSDGSTHNNLDINVGGFQELEVIDSKGCIISSNVLITPIDFDTVDINWNLETTTLNELDLEYFELQIGPNPFNQEETESIEISQNFIEFRIVSSIGLDVTSKFKRNENSLILSQEIAKGTYHLFIKIKDQWINKSLVII